MCIRDRFCLSQEEKHRLDTKNKQRSSQNNHHIVTHISKNDSCTSIFLSPPDYWQTDNSNGLVMVNRNYHWLNSASRVLISTCSAPLVQTRERKQYSLFDLDLWPTIPGQTRSRTTLIPKIKVKRFKQRRASTVKRTHTHTHGHYPCYAVDNYHGQDGTTTAITVALSK